jgi:hypothetical protein
MTKMCFELIPVFLPRRDTFTVRDHMVAETSVNIVTCRLVRVTRMTGSSLDDWICKYLDYILSKRL